MLFLHPLMLHSAGINSAQHGGGTLRVATVMEWQRARPPGPRTMWWTLNDASRAVRHDMVGQEQLFNTMVPSPQQTHGSAVVDFLVHFLVNLSLTDQCVSDILKINAPVRGFTVRLEEQVQADGSFAPAMDGRDPASEAEHEVQLIHHHDAAEYLGSVAVPRPDNIWQNWAFNTDRDETPNIVDEDPWWIRHDLRPPQTIFKLKDVATLGEDGVWRLDPKTKRVLPDKL